MRSLALKVMAFLAVLVLAGTVSVSSASASLDQCPRGFFCAWSEDDATGRFAQWEFDDSNWTDDLMHDDADTIYNNGSPGTYDDVEVFFDVNYRTLAFCLPQGEWRDWSMSDNDYDSHRWRSGC
ncbi:hypothetical protein GCM10009554_29810 [Kribbella koreensis]|uniref:Peptidase inhibitor family I36 n=2 Tax=Kribbella TaxID=182639 RepID=A0ABP6YRI8_9ACTN